MPRTLSTRPTSRSGVIARRCPMTTESVTGMAIAEGRIEAASTYTSGSSTNRNEPSHVHSSRQRGSPASRARGGTAARRASRRAPRPRTRQEEPDRAARQALPVADDHDDEQHAGADEVAQPVEERRRADERLVPQEADALGHARAERRAVDRPGLLERRPHPEQRRRRRTRTTPRRARNGTARPRPNNAPPSGGPAMTTAATRDLLDARGVGQLRRWDDGTQRAGRGGPEEGRARSLDEADGEDLPERHAVEQDRGRERGGGSARTPSAASITARAVEAIRHEAGRAARTARPAGCARR